MPLRKVIGKMVGPSGRRLIWRFEAKLFAKPYRPYLKGMRALEIGGPTDLFGDAGSLPVYSCLASVDNVNYSAQTLWQSEAVQFRETLVCEGTAIPVQDASYDCVFSSHSLEHVANPIKALLEWKRVIRDHGLLLLILPNRDYTFDWRRPVTSRIICATISNMTRLRPISPIWMKSLLCTICPVIFLREPRTNSKNDV